VLDKIYTNLADWYEMPCILPPIASPDHNVVFVRAHNVQRVNRSHKTVSSYLVRSSDPSGKALMAHALSSFNWTHLYKLNDCNCMVEYFYTCLYDLLNV